nr:YnfA family protein [Bacillus sp. SB47]
MLIAIGLFLLAGLAEIGGGYLVWLWLREAKPLWYGGVFIILAVLWGWLVDKKTPDLYDWAGAVICLAGVSVMLWAPRG